MSWIILTAVGQFLNAVVAIIDKYIVTDNSCMPKPFVYAFYSCLITGGWIAVYLLGFIPGLAERGAPSLYNIQSPSIQVVGMSFLAAYTFFMALVSMYEALRHADASDVMPVIGAVSAISSFGVSYVLLDTSLSSNFIWGILIMVIGTILVSQVHLTKNIVLHTVHSGLFFALHYISMKGLFIQTSFDDGFFWSRISLFLFALSMLLVPVYLEKIKSQTKQVCRSAGVLVLVNKTLAGVASFMLLLSTNLGEVAVVQALDGLKYVFIIIIGVFFGRFLPVSAGENALDAKTLVRKTLYVALISIGFIILFV